MGWFVQIHPVWQGLLATLFTYCVTAAGAAFVFFFKSMNQKILDLMMGFAAGVMIAASYWSLLEPAIEMVQQKGCNVLLHIAGGFLCGGAILVCSDVLMQRKNEKNNNNKWRGCILVTMAMTMHNIPEGLAVGVAFGSAAVIGQTGALLNAIMLAVGIGIQNFPEGTCVAMPLRREGMSRMKSFLIGQASGVVEPFAGVLGVLFALQVKMILPFILSFSAGAMIYVVCSELIPEAFSDNKYLATFGVMSGFVVMMLLDVLLG